MQRRELWVPGQRRRNSAWLCTPGSGLCVQQRTRHFILRLDGWSADLPWRLADWL